jgi:hypothetical protein
VTHAKDTEEAGLTWFGVRCVFRQVDNKPWGPTNLSSGVACYEERVTVWLAHSLDDAIERAEAEAAQYAEILEAEYLGFAQAYSIGEEDIEQGTEVFSLMRDSRLQPAEYLDTFFDTGTERQRAAPSVGESS